MSPVNLSLSHTTFRSSRFQVAAGLLFLGIGIVILLLREELDYLFFNQAFGDGKRYALPAGLISLAYGAAFLMMQYLRGGLFSRSERIIGNDESPEIASTPLISALKERIDGLDNELLNLKSAQLGALSGNRDELIEALKPTVHSGLADELQKRFSEQAEYAARDTEIRNSFASAQRRLQIELASLSRRSNLNLVIGVITTAIAVGLLTYMVLGSSINFDSLTSVLAHYLPRLALVVFIEIFSFFFLRLYRATLAEMRTYQTDLTALTIQFVAVQAALSARTPDSAIALSKELLATKPLSEAIAKDQKFSEADAKAVSELLQGAAKALLPKGKDG